MGKIKVTPCDIKGLYVIEPTVFKDERGYFMETYNQNDFHEAGLDMVFVLRPTENGLAWFFLRRTRSSSTFRKDLHTASWYCPMRQNLHTNVPIFIILAMRAVWHGTIRKLALSGRSRKAWS